MCLKMKIILFSAVILAIVLECMCQTTSRPECSCGMRHKRNEISKIVGGTLVQDGDYPWRVALFERSGSTGKIRFFCGGTLISENIVMTAAHCVSGRFASKEQENEIYAAVGHTDIGNLRLANLTKIAKVMPHERFRNMIGVFSSYENDIALLHLEMPLKLSENVRPACLPFVRRSSLSGTTVTASGWGRHGEEDRNSTSKMYAVELGAYTYRECRRKFFTVALLINSNVFCAYEPGKDTCKGDSGGGVDLLEDGRMHTVGIVSWGWGCARRGAPGVYTQVADYLDWIVAHSPGTSFCGLY